MRNSRNEGEEKKSAAGWTGRLGFTALLALLLMAGATGCGRTIYTETVSYPYDVNGYAVVDAGAMPMGYQNYPRAYWNGSYTYLVDGSWYYPSNGGWVILQREPPELYSYRHRYYASAGIRSDRYYRPARPVQVAPAYRARPAEYGYSRSRAPVHVAPPSRGGRVYVAPPASRGGYIRSAPSRSMGPRSAPPAMRGRGVQSAPRFHR